jgi:DNA-binding beta-propeller fold protein YncE
MASTLRIVVIAAFAGLGIALVVALAFVAMLVFPSHPTDAASLEFLGFIPLPESKSGKLLSVLDYLTVSGRTLFVPDITSGDVFEVPLGDGPLPTRSSIIVIPGSPSAHGIVIDPTTQRGFVSRSSANTVDAIDMSTRATLARIDVDDDVDGIFLDPAQQMIYAVSGDPHTATLIDPSTATKVATIPLGGKPEFAAYDPATKLIYQSINDKDQVAVVDAAKREVVDRWSLDPCQGPTGVAVDASDRRMFVVCSRNALLIVVDLDKGKIVSTVSIGGEPDSVAYDPTLKRIYSTGRPGVLSVIAQDSPDVYHTLDTVKLHYGAHTLAVDPGNHRVYVAYASLFVLPRLAVFEPRK